MKRAIMKSHPFRPLILPPIVLALALMGGNALAASQTYTLDADFDLGAMTGVNHTAPNNNQLQLNITGTSFPVLWIANAGEDTLSKVDSTQIGGSPGREIARYRTWFNSGNHAHDAWNGPAPSRTAVDAQGNAYVLDRWFGGYPTLFKILNNTFIDRNGNGVVDTSTDANNSGTIQLSEMMPLVDNNPANGMIDSAEIQDERIAWVKRVPDGTYTGSGSTPITRPNGIGRALCIGTDGNLWVGLYNNYEYYKISSVDGHTIAGPVATQYPNYGCLIDQNGTLWGANWSYGVLTRIANTGSDTGPYTVRNIPMPNAVYGLALRRDAANVTHVIMGGSCNSYVEHIDDGTNNWTKPATVNYCTYAVGADNDGNILASKTGGGVVKFNPNGTVIWDKGSQVGGSDSRGVIADANNDIWQVHRQTNNMAKYKGTDGSFLGVIPIGFEPYTYSDASGTAALSITTKTGNWDVVKDGGAAGTKWGTVSWNATVPTGAGVTAEARTSDTTAGLASQVFQPVTNGTPFTMTGRYIEVKVTLNANPQNQSPIVQDVTVASTVQLKCDVDKDGDIDQADLSLISRARGQRATGPDDPRDSDGDGLITPNDVKRCIPQCTRLNCTVQ
ncbi:hypothetical protein KI811_01890 [Geobacter hydrogenophilus]|uniref:Dockerin domain-containing protein n=1 Tax=Geobacter hydrogenophilus TaxID=40983 RepID=A0A9W6G3Z3_9BACT|nr:hypothetical protein [Geobacter hydrogenophilus]MBT0892573.1 hypothetical protein [Geobacter hydrogenophilus]GLI39970.1 hypothetical protein GHYDROH2_34710 [Geobacter hydrogenophilus]